MDKNKCFEAITIAKKTKATSLNLENMNIKVLPDAVFDLPSLKELNLKQNQLSEISKNIEKLKNLKCLYLESNQFKEIPLSIFHIDKLQILNIKKNKVSKIPGNIPKNNVLKELYAEENDFAKIPLEILYFRNLEKLHLGNNKIITIPHEIRKLKILKELFLENNQISELPPFVCELKKLRKLRLKNNRISRLPDNFKKLADLEFLDLRFNLLSIPNDLLFYLTPKSIVDKIISYQPKKVKQNGYIYYEKINIPITEGLAETSHGLFRHSLAQLRGDSIAVLDEFHLKAFLRSCINEGIISTSDLEPVLRSQTRGYRKLSLMVNQALLLFDKVIFVYDGAGRGPTYKYRDKLVGPVNNILNYRLGLFRGELSPSNSTNDTSIDDYTIGIIGGSRGIHVIPSWFKKFKSYNSLDQEIDYICSHDTERRATPDHFIESWPISARYAQRSPVAFPHILIGDSYRQYWDYLKERPRLFSSINILSCLVKIYLECPPEKIITEIRKFIKPAKSDQQAKSFFSLILLELFWSHSIFMSLISYSEYLDGIGVVSVDTKYKQKKNIDIPYQVLRILISNLSENGLILPHFNRTADVLRLREKFEICEFRQLLWGWAYEFQKCNVTGSEKIRKEVVKANKSLKAIGRFKKLSDWSLYLSFPAMIGDMFSGLPLLSSYCIISSLGLKINQHTYEKRTNWLKILGAM